MSTGNTIKMIRKQKGISAELLAEKVGVSPSTIYRYESGETRKVSDLLIDKIADVLHVSKFTLIAEDIDVEVLDAQMKADWIKEELIRMRITDSEFDLLENYIQFLKSQRRG